ncbi:hypothetical protein BCR39DRAFT_545694 [Naematelia encephala]|uniref:VHS domain-containing protein n=1 Tax=Naematelia encephala TaxID=71784 RepID=A0A1Y2AQR1_9TREE|nr:hypothetical protein BCR39DRAFT_545694 [Naematelia encephala]
MKRLFRTSKTAVDPLPPPPPTTAISNSSTSATTAISTTQPPSKKSLATMMGVGNGNGNGGNGGGGGGGGGIVVEDHHHHKSRHGGTHVTPFPLDVGRDTNTPTPPPLPTKGPPSLLEIQQMNEERERDRRRDEWLAAQRSGRPPPPPPSRPSNAPGQGQGVGQISASAPIPSPDGWSVISGPTIREGQGHYSAPIPIGTTPTPPSNSSTPTIQQVSLYLPPGARPPSPQQHRPATPTRAPYPSSLGHSQTSAMSVGSPYAPVELDHYAPPSRAGRERGYSGASASARSSDHESGHSHSHSHSHGHGPPTPQKLNKVQPSLYAARSPLVNSYDAPGATQFPVPHPQMPHPLPHPQAFTPLADDVQAMRISEPPDTREKEKEKEKKKFWGMNVNMNWADRRDRDTHRREKNRDILDARPSFDEQDAWRDESSLGHGFVGSTGHGEEDARPKILGLDFGRSKDPQTQPAQVEKVNVAIQLLCAQPDPPFASAYEVCDRINHSSSAESVAKEAAAALRKQFKHGNEAERRNAAKVWLITMRNIEAKGYRGHATSKKFMAALEPILLAPPAKPLVSGNTHRIMTDILADLTYNFGAEKGCEGLGELWRKVKMPQESDLGKPLPADHPLYTPDSFYTAHITPPNSLPSSRRPSSPPSLSHLGPNDRSVPPPLPIRGPSPTFGGYAQLPNHGEDMRRLTDECIAAKESARVLMEALVYTRPEELELKPIIREFYEKCFHAHESLTNQMDWAQAEAAQSRERVIMIPGSDEHLEPTIEERALSSLFEAHSQLAEALKQHDDMERMAMDEREMREVRERSKKDIRMDRSQNALLRPENGASSSRSPSPAPPARLPVPDKLVSSPRQVDVHLPMHSNNPFRGTAGTLDRSRTPSPDRGPLPHPPKIIAASPARPGSPLGRTRAPAHRPLPNPFSRGNNGSQQSLREGANPNPNTNTNTNPSRSGTGSTQESSSAPKTADEDDDDEDIPVRPIKPSRKALGKRRAVIDEDNHFDPDDMFLEVKKEKDTSASSEESYTADDFYLVPQKSIKYAYDAYQDKLNRELEAAGRVGASGGGHAGGSRMIHA